MKLIYFLAILINSIIAFGQAGQHDSFKNLCFPGTTVPPDELFRKRVQEPGMKYGNPYSMFNKGEDFDINKQLSKIRLNIKKDEPFLLNNIKNVDSRFYNSLFDLAFSP